MFFVVEMQQFFNKKEHNIKMLNLKINKKDPILLYGFGILEKLTILATILKLFNIIKWNWFITLIPLWFALIFGFLLGLTWFICELIEIIKEGKND
jgi:hypothetical protein